MGKGFFLLAFFCFLLLCVSCATGRPQAARPEQYRVTSNTHPPLQAPLAASDDADKYEVVDKDRIYYGNSNNFTRPACLSLKSVFQEIPEYMTIVRKRLTYQDPHYWVLLNAANEVFRKVVRGVASEYKHDLIGEQGSIRSKSEEDVIPDVTHLALLYLKDLMEK
jgi:hypothetical protein